MLHLKVSNTNKPLKNYPIGYIQLGLYSLYKFVRHFRATEKKIKLKINEILSIVFHINLSN